METTISASKITYQIEAMKILKMRKNVIKNYVETVKKLKLFPYELDYLESFYDEKTGSSGSFFYNKENGEYILAYTGTNSVTDIEKDMYADIYGVCMGQGQHYRSCFNFYKKMVKKYGENIILTGHSLGGNIAQRVALEFNVKRSIIYNSAPLYIKNGVDLFVDVNDNRENYLKMIKRYKRTALAINNKMKLFDGGIYHFSSENDILNRVMNILGDDAVYIGKRYILKDAGIHSLKAIMQKYDDVIKNVLNDKAVMGNYFASEYKEINSDEKESFLSLTTDKTKATDYFLKMFLGNNHVLNYMTNKMEDIDISKFIKKVFLNDN